MPSIVCWKQKVFHQQMSVQCGMALAMGTVGGAGAPAKEGRRKPEWRVACLLSSIHISLQNGAFADAGGVVGPCRGWGDITASLALQVVTSSCPSAARTHYGPFNLSSEILRESCSHQLLCSRSSIMGHYHQESPVNLTSPRLCI